MHLFVLPGWQVCAGQGRSPTINFPFQWVTKTVLSPWQQLRSYISNRYLDYVPATPKSIIQSMAAALANIYSVPASPQKQCSLDGNNFVPLTYILHPNDSQKQYSGYGNSYVLLPYYISHPSVPQKQCSLDNDSIVSWTHTRLSWRDEEGNCGTVYVNHHSVTTCWLKNVQLMHCCFQSGRRESPYSCLKVEHDAVAILWVSLLSDFDYRINYQLIFLFFYAH